MSQQSAAGVSADEYNNILRYIGALRLADLKLVAKSLSIAQAGRKADVADRIKRYLQIGIDTNDVLRVRSIAKVVDAAYRSEQVPAYEAVYSSLMLTTNGGLGGSQTSNHNNYSQDSLPKSQTNPRKPWLFFKENPFFLLKKLVTPNAGICAKAPDTRGTCRVSFTLNDQDTELLQQSTKYKLFLLCGVYDRNKPPTDALIEFPQPLEIHFNGVQVKDNVKGLKNKPGTARPANLTPYVANARRTNNLEMVYAFTKSDYLIFCYLIEEVPPERILQKILANDHIAKQRAIYEIRHGADDDDEDEIQEVSTTLSLKCPLSFTRFKYPTKSIACKHRACFDALSFVYLQEQASTWICPVCSIPVRVKDLAIDDYMMDIMKNTHEDIETVEINLDGSWKPISEDDEGTPKKKQSTPALKKEPGVSSSTCASSQAPVEKASPVIISLDSDDEEEEAQTEPVTTQAANPVENLTPLSNQSIGGTVGDKSSTTPQAAMPPLAEPRKPQQQEAPHIQPQVAQPPMEQQNLEHPQPIRPAIQPRPMHPAQEQHQQQQSQFHEHHHNHRPHQTPVRSQTHVNQYQRALPPLVALNSPQQSSSLFSPERPTQNQIQHNAQQHPQQGQYQNQRPHHLYLQQPNAQQGQLLRPSPSLTNSIIESQGNTSNVAPPVTNTAASQPVQNTHSVSGAPHIRKPPPSSPVQTQTGAIASGPSTAPHDISAPQLRTMPATTNSSPLITENVFQGASGGLPQRRNSTNQIQSLSAVHRSNSSVNRSGTSGAEQSGGKKSLYEAEMQDLNMLKKRMHQANSGSNSRASPVLPTAVSPVVPPAVPSHRRFDRLSTNYPISASTHSPVSVEGVTAAQPPSQGRVMGPMSTGTSGINQKAPQVAQAAPVTNVTTGPKPQSTRRTSNNGTVFSDQPRTISADPVAVNSSHLQQEQQINSDARRRQENALSFLNNHHAFPPLPLNQQAQSVYEQRRTASNPDALFSQTVQQSNLKASLDQYQERNGINRSNTINIPHSHGHSGALQNIQKLNNSLSNRGQNTQPVQPPHSKFTHPPPSGSVMLLNDIQSHIDAHIQQVAEAESANSSAVQSPISRPDTPQTTSHAASSTTLPPLPKSNMSAFPAAPPSNPSVPSQTSPQPVASGPVSNANPSISVNVPNWTKNNLLRSASTAFSPSRFGPAPSSTTKAQVENTDTACASSGVAVAPTTITAPVPSAPVPSSTPSAAPSAAPSTAPAVPTPSGPVAQSVSSAPAVPAVPPSAGGILGINVDPNSLLGKPGDETRPLEKSKSIPNIFIPTKRPVSAEKRKVSYHAPGQDNVKRPTIEKAGTLPNLNGSSPSRSEVVDLTSDDDDDTPLKHRDDDPLARYQSR